MKISVVIPTYKPRAYLWECLDSLVAQTFPKKDFEVILVLNGCTEPWKTQIEHYIASQMQGMNVVFLHTEQAGVSNARNLALDIAKGEYITFIDDDDYVSPQYLEELHKAATPDTVSLCYPYAFNDGQPDIQLPYAITDAYEYSKIHGCGSLSSKVRKFFSGPCMKLLHSSFIQGRRYDVRFANGEDSLFMFLISDRIKHTALASPCAIYYRRYRENSATTKKQSIAYVVNNTLKQCCCYSKYYLRNPFAYNFPFFISRLLAAGKTCLLK